MQVKEIISEIIDWGKALAFALVLSFLVSIFIIQPYSVSGSSMEPTLEGKDVVEKDKDGDRIFIFKAAYIVGKEPKVNDIVVVDSRFNYERSVKDSILESPFIRTVFNKNNAETYLWVKRIIGEPGDILEFKEGKVFRNGLELKEDYIKEEMVFPFETIEIPENHVFVMGDNRNGSIDSRVVGPIPTDNVVGKVFVRYYPFSKIKLF